MAMAVIADSAGATIFGVDKIGGSLIGLSIDEQGKMTSAGTKLLVDGFTSLTATRVAGHNIVSAVTGNTTVVSMISDDFTRIDLLAKLDGNLAAPIVDANGLHLALTAGPSGLNVAGFTASWQEKGAAQLASTAIGMDATAIGADALVAWSTPTGCTVEQLGTPRTATGLTACRSPRLAAGPGFRAELAYEDSHGVRVGDLYMSGNNAIASTHAIGAAGRSPRIAFDGERYWMTYIDARGNVVVGFLAPNLDTLVSFALEDVSPNPDAYDLKIVGGQPWVFSADATGFAAHALCLAHQ